MKNCAKRIITMLTVLFLAGCGKPTPPDKKRVQSVNIVEESVSLLVDETKALTCVILPEDAEDNEDKLYFSYSAVKVFRTTHKYSDFSVILFFSVPFFIAH